ncbi:MAG: DUF362 domain-containing protein [Bacteroidales bacterium]|nr:DUF362 domain-containing protein [Bacteroidales bacterium]
MKNKALLFVSIFCLFVNLAWAQTASNTIVSVKSTDFYYAAKTGISKLGGMTQFVKPGQKVGILINSAFDEKGAYVNPDIAIAVVVECFEAGASEVIGLQMITNEYWQRSSLYERFKDILAKVKMVESNVFPATYNETDYIRLDTIMGAKSLVKPEIVKALFEVDVLINVPIAKHHATTKLTCAVKNMMGVCTRATNVGMHLKGPKRNDHDFLAQCIADLNLVRKPDLIVTDVTEVIITNGPGGPGEIAKHDRVVVGTDLVAMDAYCTQLIGFEPEDVYTTAKAAEHGLGEPDLSKVKILEF